jgi:hypothetical protein
MPFNTTMGALYGLSVRGSTIEAEASTWNAKGLNGVLSR